MPVIANEKVQVFVGPEVTFADFTLHAGLFRHQRAEHRPAIAFPALQRQWRVEGRKARRQPACTTSTDHWFLDGDLGIERLLGSAPGSPIVQTDWGYSVAATLNYTF